MTISSLIGLRSYVNLNNDLKEGGVEVSHKVVSSEDIFVALQGSSKKLRLA